MDSLYLHVSAISCEAEIVSFFSSPSRRFPGYKHTISLNNPQTLDVLTLFRFSFFFLFSSSFISLSSDISFPLHVRNKSQPKTEKEKRTENNSDSLRNVRLAI